MHPGVNGIGISPFHTFLLFLLPFSLYISFHPLDRVQVRPATDGGLPFQYFDGATFMTYQFPSRIEEELFCRDDRDDPNNYTQFLFFPKKVACEKQYQDENEANN